MLLDLLPGDDSFHALNVVVVVVVVVVAESCCSQLRVIYSDQHLLWQHLQVAWPPPSFFLFLNALLPLLLLLLR